MITNKLRSWPQKSLVINVLPSESPVTPILRKEALVLHGINAQTFREEYGIFVSGGPTLLYQKAFGVAFDSTAATK